MNIYHIEFPDWLTATFVEKLSVRIVLLAIVVQCDTVNAVLEGV
jgi:hypothetical protein